MSDYIPISIKQYNLRPDFLQSWLQKRFHDASIEVHVSGDCLTFYLPQDLNDEDAVAIRKLQKQSQKTPQK